MCIYYINDISICTCTCIIDYNNNYDFVVSLFVLTAKRFKLYYFESINIVKSLSQMLLVAPVTHSLLLYCVTHSSAAVSCDYTHTHVYYMYMRIVVYSMYMYMCVCDSNSNCSITVMCNYIHHSVLLLWQQIEATDRLSSIVWECSFL